MMIPIGINEVINVAKNELLNKAKSMDKVSKDFKELYKPINNFTKGCENRATNETDGQQDAKKANKMKDTQNPEKKQSRESEANEKDNVDTKSNNENDENEGEKELTEDEINEKQRIQDRSGHRMHHNDAVRGHRLHVERVPAARNGLLRLGKDGGIVQLGRQPLRVFRRHLSGRCHS